MNLITHARPYPNSPLPLFIKSRSAVFFALLLLPTFAFALSGQVTNGTLSRPEPNVTVSYIHHAKGDVTVVRDTTDEQGRFTLDVPADPNADPPPMLIARYKNIDYPGNPALEGGSIDIPVYEISDQDTALSVATHHVLVDLTSRQATYILIIKNSSNRTYLTGGEHGHGLELPLPEGVTDIVSAPEGVHLHGSVLVDPRPIIPGQSQAFFTFALPENNHLNQTMTYATASFDLLVQPADSKVTAESLHDHGTVNFGEQTFQQFAGVNLIPGTRISISFGEDNGGAPENAVIAILVIAGILLVGVIVYRVRKPKAPSPSGSRDRRTALLEQIADLDDRFEGGKISEADYRMRRDVLKSEIEDLSETRQSLLAKIADLDRYEKGDVSPQRYQQQRDALKKRVAGLARQG